MLKILRTLLFLFSASLYSENVHPRFTITSEDLENIYTYESDETKMAISLSEYNFLEIIDKLLLNNSVDLQLVDKKNKLDRNYIPENLVNLSDYGLHTRYKTMLFIEEAIDDFVEMSNKATKDGIDLFIASTYRPYEFQNKIFNNMKNYHGEEKAATIVAYPGASQHQLGAAVDFGTITPSYANTDAGKWLLENSWKFGFTLSYPKGKENITTYVWEPWHFRYIGYYAAMIQRDFFQDIQHLFLVFWNKYSLFFIENHIQ